MIHRPNPTDGPSEQDRCEELPLVFDLDGTLTPSDATLEHLAMLAVRHPRSALRAVAAGFGSRLQMKKIAAERLGAAKPPLPLNEEVVNYARYESSRGREVHLVTASHQLVADEVSDQLGIFDTAVGSLDTNLKGSRKASYLQTRFPNGFSYVGDSAADFEVWKAATSGSVVGTRGSGPRAFFRSGVHVDKTFARPTASFADWTRQARLHQWTKNLIVFVALLLGHRYDDWGNWAIVTLGFISISLTASGTYILNDLFDLGADRLHPTKRRRPLASGRIGILGALAASLAFLLTGIALSLLTPLGFLTLVVVYTVTTLAYSLRLKQIPLVDTFVIGGLFTVRVGMGAALLEIELSHWLLVFSMFFFVSLALAKRHVELVRAQSRPDSALRGRGYQKSDVNMTRGLGLNTAYLSILVSILYLIDEAFDTELYASGEILWGMPLIISLWLARVWVQADRGMLDDDPVIFAVKDRPSLIYGAALALLFVLAVVGI